MDGCHLHHCPSGVPLGIGLLAVDKQRLVLPSITELLIYAFLTFTVVAIIQYENVLSFLTGQPQGAMSFEQVLSDAFAERVDAFFALIDSNDLTGSVLIALFWALIGAAVYVIVSTAARFFYEAEEDVVAETNYVHPRGYSHLSFWAQFSFRVVFRSAMLVAIGLFVFLAAEVLIPLWIEMINEWINQPSDMSEIIDGFLALIGFMMTWHVVPVLSRLMFMRRRVFSQS